MTKQEKLTHCKEHAPELLDPSFWQTMKKELEFLSSATSAEMNGRYNWKGGDRHGK